MRIGYLCHHGIFESGGPGRRTAGLLSALAALGHEVHVRATALPPGLAAVCHKADGEGLAELARSADACLVRLDGSCHAERLAEEVLALKPGLPVVLEVHAPLEEQLLYGGDLAERRRWVERGNAVRRRLADGGARAVCVSEGMFRYAREFMGAREALVAPNAAAPELFRPGAAPDAAFTALWTGSARYPWQAADVVLDAARQATDLRFLLACPSPEGLPGSLPTNVELVGSPSRSELAGLYARAGAALVLYHPVPGSAWGFYLSPLKLYEAMAAGRPVVGSNLGQVAEAVRSSGCGILVGEDAGSVVRALRGLAADRAAACQMGRRGRERAERRTWTDAAREMAGFIAGGENPCC
jgi:glycosyltransferase involved in cell wall biosynthesis